MASRSIGGPLFQKYPVHTTWEFTIQGNSEPVRGRIYTTDEASGVVVLQSALVHTTLATEMRIIQASAIQKAQKIEVDEQEEANNPPLTLPKVQKKALEEREKRALKLTEESLRHINQKVRQQPVLRSWNVSGVDKSNSPTNTHAHTRERTNHIISSSSLIGRPSTIFSSHSPQLYSYTMQ